MDNKVILISIDGMRPDGVQNCGNAYVQTLQKISSFTYNATTVFPSVTLPCHMSLFHSVPPERHGTTTNTYMPQVRPVSGLFEQLSTAGGVGAMYYGWEPIRDISTPGSLKHSEYINAYSFDNTDSMLTNSALEYIRLKKPDLVFLYMVETDEKGGHDCGWMSEGYLKVVSSAIDNVKKVIEETNGEYTVIISADHGGHDRAHGTNMYEDMTIPMFFYGPMFEAGKELKDVSILDLAPTIADILNINKPREWEGKSLLKEN